MIDYFHLFTEVVIQYKFDCKSKVVLSDEKNPFFPEENKTQGKNSCKKKKKPESSYSKKPESSNSKKPESSNSKKPDYSNSTKPEASNSKMSEYSNSKKPDASSSKTQTSVKPPGEGLQTEPSSCGNLKQDLFGDSDDSDWEELDGGRCLA